MKRNLYYEDELLEEQFNGFMFRRLASYASEYKAEYIRVFLLLVGSSFLALIPAAVNMIIINEVLPKDGMVPEHAFEMAAVLLSVWAALSIGAVTASFLADKAALILGNKVICRLREDVFERLMELDFDYYDSRPTGKILIRITNYTDEIADFFIDDMMRVLQNVFIMAVAVVCICLVDVRMAVMAVLVSIPLAALMWKIAGALHRKMRVERNKQSNRTAFVAEDINGLEVIQAFNREALNDEIFQELSQKYQDAFMGSTRYRELFFPLSYAGVRILCTLAMYFTALYIITNHTGAQLTLGALVTVTAYMQRFSSAVNVLCQRLQSFTNVTSNIERVFEVLDTPSGIVEKEDAKELAVPEGKVEFEHVSFSYIPGTPVLTDVSFCIEPGQMTALVGPTGGGKTTIVSLLSRFYDINEGRIFIDGTDIRDVTLDSLRERVGVMMQDAFLFCGEIIENIRFSRPDASDEECIEAAKKVLAHDFIMKKPQGYHTVISSQGNELSGGERQLISFARLILKDPDIIILDEATSNIDTETEQLIQNMFASVLKGKTSFVIAHRLSTIQNADRILYVDGNRILEDGSHGELMEKKGLYYRLVKNCK